ncbi:MAG TPA: sigma 54-interacting response regulator [Chitinophagaceae bacterium]|nr:sigma 54-interacting response regulator [Chitinophagaceae bacterium]
MKATVLIVEDQYVEANYLRTMLEKAGYSVTGIARSVQKARELIEAEKPGLVLLDIFLSGKNTGIDLAIHLREENIAFVYLSANSNEEVLTAAKATQPYGFLVKPFRERDLLITLEIAKYRHEHSTEATLQRETVLHKTLKGIFSKEENVAAKLLAIAKALQAHIPFDYFVASATESATWLPQFFSCLRTGFDEYQDIGIEQLQNITGLSSEAIQHITERSERPYDNLPYNEKDFEALRKQIKAVNLFANSFHLKSAISFTVQPVTSVIVHIEFYSRRPDAYLNDHTSFFNRLLPILQNGFEKILERSSAPNTSAPQYVTQHSLSKPGIEQPVFHGIIGNSHLLLNVFDHITQVAPSDTSVLILGESGTGKERIADCIHQLSRRKQHPLVKVNCAALPSTLIESELFGHEKGSFTGATDTRIGKFEKANKGTLFLDEVGEMPLELQVKLLRVLQEKEIERIGAKTVTKIDVRIIAATNRNLEKEVAEGRFRLDLYYRLNVFPILLPSLRDRKEDIPLLIQHFVQYYNRKSGKKINGVTEKALKNMLAYHWPGNIRELEHFIERSVLLTKTNSIDEAHFTGITAKPSKVSPEDGAMKTIQENERDYIITVLKKCNGRIWGPGAAAEILNIPPSTLKSKMKKLGIKKEYTGS